MRQMRLTTAIVLIFCAFISGAIAQTSPEVVVTGSRITEETTAKPQGGVLPVSKVSLSYTVNAQGLDLSSQEGKAKLEKSVSDAAVAVCSELKRKYPLSKTSEQECVRQAKADAMLKTRELEAAANKGNAK